MIAPVSIGYVGNQAYQYQKKVPCQLARDFFLVCFAIITMQNRKLYVIQPLQSYCFGPNSFRNAHQRPKFD